MEYTLNITWGQRVHLCNQFPTVGTLHEMQISHVMRNILIEAVDAATLSKNGITKDELGVYTIPANKESRPSEITLNDASLKLFYEFIDDLDKNAKVYLQFESIFTLVVETYEESQQTEHDPEDSEEPQEQ